MLRLVYVLFWVLIFLIPVSIASLLPMKYRRGLHKVMYRFLTRIFRIKIKVRGKISSKQPIVFVSNHMSYVDIMVLGASLPGCFVSKAEVKKWPLIGWIAMLTGTVFVNRQKSGARDQVGDLDKALNNGKNLILFPEGTTSSGHHVLPFKSSLFRVVEKRMQEGSITVQPVTLSYTHINGLPVQANERVKIAWVGDAELLPHLLEFVNLGIIRAEVKVHAPIELHGTRKEIAEAAHNVVTAWKS